MCTSPSAPPESARSTAPRSLLPFDPLRPVSTRSSIGSETPDTPSMPVLQQARHHVTGCGAEDVGEHEHAVAGVQAVEQLARAQHQIVGVVLAPHAEGRDLLGHVAEDLGRAREQRLADAAVRDDEDADHEVLCSSASMNIPETSNPV